MHAEKKKIDRLKRCIVFKSFLLDSKKLMKMIEKN